ncbi:ATP-binding protein, Mrp/Nbp35 family protein [Mycolicibacterium canariasense]|uniref:ATP-binding protein, Mrp/Nbp35 family protein n=1 Tax=Mycolicibacterium canariasense TaxID=228230 RepID=A0A124E1Q7_MYCCR|nr:hypothetical protein [Mycolicibacterium canariasense]MCV7208803.1 hypothetical protein [Mycolicibacterium canariasense]ORV07132.1 hypothetical protein AWB94_14110 [Mycolicibacterium canariasense]GAS94410.1 ATP-binding protein, Mrp/Nbp35 family protein [Mycolicibacterium canariasense]
MTATDTGLEALLEAFADPTTHRVLWTYRCDLGIAGHVQLTLDLLHPYRLTQAERDTILATAARLVNWSDT